MTQLQVLKYRTAASELLEQGFGEAAAGDLRQASEKGWGAAAIAVKAVAEGRGWSHGSHDALFAAVSRLARELPEAGLFTDFQVAVPASEFLRGLADAGDGGARAGAGAAVCRDGDGSGDRIASPNTRE